MSDAGGPPGVNSAIASGSAFGGGGEGGPGTVTSILDIVGSVSKAGLKSEGTQLFTGEFLGGTGAGLGGLKDTGIFSKIFDALFAGADPKDAFGAFSDESAASGGGGGDDGGNAFPSTMGAAQGAVDAGMEYDGSMMAGTRVSPSATPGISAGIGEGMEI